MFNIFKKTNKYGNYPYPKNGWSEKEQKKNEEYNKKILFEEIYTQNDRIVELLGGKITTDNSKLPAREMTIEEIDECVKLIIAELNVIITFGDLMQKEQGQQFDIWQKAKSARFKGLSQGQRIEMPKLDTTPFYVPHLRELFKEARLNPKESQKEKKEYTEEEQRVNATREERQKALASLCNTIPSVFSIQMGIRDMSMIYMGMNWYGAKNPLYDKRGWAF